MTRYCSYADCGRELTRHSARGLCTGHYQQWKRGENLQPLAPRNVLIPWLEAHVDHEGDDCLIWPFPPATSGYGQVKRNGRMMGAHRLMCELAHGKPPTPMHQAAHSCGQGHKGCVNPRHLRWATCIENKADMLIHGTRPRGERQGSAKLKPQDVLAIRSRAGQSSQQAIASEYGIRQSTVFKIIHRQRWGHI